MTAQETALAMLRAGRSYAEAAESSGLPVKEVSALMDALVKEPVRRIKKGNT